MSMLPAELKLDDESCLIILSVSPFTTLTEIALLDPDGFVVCWKKLRLSPFAAPFPAPTLLATCDVADKEFFDSPLILISPEVVVSVDDLNSILLSADPITAAPATSMPLPNKRVAADNPLLESMTKD